MKLHNPTAESFVPDGKPVASALKRITHLGIGAHQDDLEFMAFHGILKCLRQQIKMVRRGDLHERLGQRPHRQIQEIFRRPNDGGSPAEQNRAAKLGKFGVMLQLDYPSSAVKSATDPALKEDLKKILTATRPEIVYTHNLADKHDTHIGVVVAAIQAMRELPRRHRPKRVIGCEVWRDLDWLADADKVVMDVSGHDKLAARS